MVNPSAGSTRIDMIWEVLTAVGATPAEAREAVAEEGVIVTAAQAIQHLAEAKHRNTLRLVKFPNTGQIQSKDLT